MPDSFIIVRLISTCSVCHNCALFFSQTLTREILTILDSCLKAEVLKWAAFYEHRLHLGSKEILHLEAFVAKYMSIYKAHIIAE